MADIMSRVGATEDLTKTIFEVATKPATRDHADGLRPLVSCCARRAVVAIPASNEVDCICACLRALSEQTGLEHDRLGVVVFVNRSTDGTSEKIRLLSLELPLEIRMFEDCEVRPASAGWARRIAMEAAADWLLEDETGSQGGSLRAILTTDADTVVPRDWVVRNLAAIGAGVDAVAGQFEIDAADAKHLPPHLRVRIWLEKWYEYLTAELAWRLRPDLRDPWPRHAATSGASLAVELRAYRAVGGLPEVTVGEDQALIQAVLAAGGLVRHDPQIRVVTSGRLTGRAAGGFSDGLRLRAYAWNSPCDERLKPAAGVLFAPKRKGVRSLRPVELPLQMAIAVLCLVAIRFIDFLKGRRPG